LSAIFDPEGVLLAVDGVSIEGIAPKLTVRGGALPAEPVNGDRWDVYGVGYIVGRVIPDGQGGFYLYGEVIEA
jgi:hypothetical protein